MSGGRAVHVIDVHETTMTPRGRRPVWSAQAQRVLAYFGSWDRVTGRMILKMPHVGRKTYKEILRGCPDQFRAQIQDTSPTLTDVREGVASPPRLPVTHRELMHLATLARRLADAIDTLDLPVAYGRKKP